MTFDINDAYKEMVKKSAGGAFPWEGIPEDHFEPEQLLTKLIPGAPPRFVWTSSPSAMYTAINMLRSIHKGQRHKFIEALVLQDDLIPCAKVIAFDSPRPVIPYEHKVPNVPN